MPTEGCRMARRLGRWALSQANAPAALPECLGTSTVPLHIERAGHSASTRHWQHTQAPVRSQDSISSVWRL